MKIKICLYQLVLLNIHYTMQGFRVTQLNLGAAQVSKYAGVDFAR